MRVRNGWLETSCVEFEHPKTQSQIGLIGMMHVGSPDYYQWVQTYMDNRASAGARIHYESIREPTTEEKEQDPEMAAIFDQTVGVPNLATDHVIKEWGMVKQVDAVKLPADAECYDLSAVKFVEAVGFADLASRVQEYEKGAKAFARFDPEVRDLCVRGVFRLLPHMEFSTRFITAAGRSTAPRNQAELDGIRQTLEADPGARISVFWGEGHMDGLIKGVRKMDYRQTNKWHVPAVPIGGEQRLKKPSKWAHAPVAS